MSLTSLPFDGTQDFPRPVPASDRRMLYRDLWSNMIIERFTFVQNEGNNFTVTGVCLVDGAYARFRNHSVSIQESSTTNPRVIVAHIVSETEGQNVGFSFAERAGDNELAVAELNPSGDSWHPVGFGLSPIRIPDRTIIGTKMVGQTISQAELANNSIITRTIADRNVTAAKIATRSITQNELTNNVLNHFFAQGRAAIGTASLASQATRSINIVAPAGFSPIPLGMYANVSGLTTNIAEISGQTLVVTVRNVRATTFNSTSNHAVYAMFRRIS
jgi:hypothetical protein